MVVNAMASEEYLSKRKPEMIAQDLRLVSLLLCSGMGEGWITEKEYFDMTHKIWVPLFFSKNYYSNQGWIEYRTNTEEFTDDFISKMKSATLSASIIAWALGLPEEYDTLEGIRLHLACILSFARLPWLWQGDDINKIAKELKPMLELSTKRDKEYDKYEWDKISAKWQIVTRAGDALKQFESAMKEKDYTPVGIKDKIKVNEVKKGEILWEGNSGICILTKDCFRLNNVNTKAKALKLQGKIEETEFGSTDVIIPLRAILNDYDLLSVKELGKIYRETLLSMLDNLSPRIKKIDIENIK